MKRHPISLLLFILLLLLSCTVPSGAAPAAPATRPATTRPAEQARQRRLHLQQLTRQAINQLEQGKVTDAEQTLAEALNLGPTSAINLYNMACAKARLGRRDAAMDYLERSAMQGFTDFGHIAADPDLVSLHPLPRFQRFLSRKDEFLKRSAQQVLDFLRGQLGDHYLYQLDEQHKLIFASDTDAETLRSLKSWLIRQAASQWQQLFDHKPDYYIVILLPNPADFRKMVPMRGVGGLYSPERRTLVCQKMGQVVTHEFTHALHAADIDPLGQEHPIWLTEGLASMFEAGRFEGDTLVPADNYRLAAIQRAGRNGRLIPLKRLLQMDQKEFVSRATFAYGQSSSLLLYLYDQGLLKKFYVAFKRNWEHDKTGEKTLQEVTGRPLAKLESDWKTWMLARKPPVLFTGENGVVLGVKFIEQNDGLRVDYVAPGGPAARAGVRAGDTIVGLNDDDVRDPQSLVPLLATHAPGDEVVLHLRRGVKYLELPVTLARRSTLPDAPAQRR